MTEKTNQGSAAFEQLRQEHEKRPWYTRLIACLKRPKKSAYADTSPAQIKAVQAIAEETARVEAVKRREAYRQERARINENASTAAALRGHFSGRGDRGLK